MVSSVQAFEEQEGVHRKKKDKLCRQIVQLEAKCTQAHKAGEQASAEAQEWRHRCVEATELSQDLQQELSGLSAQLTQRDEDVQQLEHNLAEQQTQVRTSAVSSTRLEGDDVDMCTGTDDGLLSKRGYSGADLRMSHCRVQSR